METKLKKIKRELIRANIPVKEVQIGNFQVEDPTIVLDDRFHIQIPYYTSEIVLVEELPDGSFLFHEPVRTIKLLIAQILLNMKKGKQKEALKKIKTYYSETLSKNVTIPES